MSLYSNLIRSAAAAAFLCAAFPLSAEINDSGKNVLNVEWRILPGDYEKLPATESSKWNFNFRPSGKEAAALLWTDPNTVRDLTGDGESDIAGQEPTSLYACCDEEGLTILVYGVHKDPSIALKDGKKLPFVRVETFLLPGDADDPQIQNYHPFGYQSVAPHLQYNLSWMKFDRKNRPLIPTLILGSRRVSNGTVCRITYPWFPLWDRLPFTKKNCPFLLVRVVPGSDT